MLHPLPMKPVLVITGPTASGKSGAAIPLGKALGGTVINADAMQVYQDLLVLTARPTNADMAGIPHRLYGIADGAERWSAGRFATVAARSIEEVEAEGRLPILVGGTGLWLKALTQGLSPIPDVPDAVAAEAAADWDQDADGLRRALLAVDPPMATLAHRDAQRHIRAWAVYRATARPLSEWQAAPPVPVIERAFVRLVLMPPRHVAYAKADQRFLEMLRGGAVEEVRALMTRALAPSLPVMKAVGVPELAAVLDGEKALPDATALAQQATRRLIKRQSTWLGGQFADWPRFETAEALIDGALSALEGRQRR